MRQTTMAVAGALSLALAFAASACTGSESTPKGDSGTLPAGQDEELCSSLRHLDSTIEQIAGPSVDPETITVADVQDALGWVRSQVEDAAVDLPSSVEAELQTALADIQDALRDLPAQEPLANPDSYVPSALDQLESVWHETLDALDCQPPPS